MSAKRYDADEITVLKGLEPVQKRPGMYTDTTRPNHLGQEVIDNSVDEALSGYATRIDVILHKDNSLEVIDDGRGMPVDIHSSEKVSGVELILTKLHAGGKFSNKNYTFSGGLHGVGISVVNALSKRVDIQIKRNGEIYTIAFENGEKVEELTVIGTCPKKQTGTTVRFYPNPIYFESPKFSVSRLRHLLRAKAILCPKLTINFINQIDGTEDRWYYEDGLTDYLCETLNEHDYLPNPPFIGNIAKETEALSWALCWLPNGGVQLGESYVNLIPTTLGGTHVNGLRSGLFKAMDEFCDTQKLLPKGVKLTADDVWSHCCYVLSLKMQEPQFAGQTKERLSSRQASGYVESTIKDTFILWLNENLDTAKQLAEMAISSAQKRLESEQKVVRKKVVNGPALPGKLSDCTSQDTTRTELFLVEGDSAGGTAKKARDKDFQAILPLRGKIKNTWGDPSQQVLSSEEVHNIAIAMGIDPDNDDLSQIRYGKVCILADADSDGLHIATLLCALFLRHFPALVKTGRVYVAMPPLYRIDFGKDEIHYALDEADKDRILAQLAKKKKGTPDVQRFKGLGEMNADQLRETTMNPNTRRLVQLTFNEELDQEDEVSTFELMDMLMNDKRSKDRKSWLEARGDQADLSV
ncbi:DNA topoisomerase IV subunit B [Haemophilus paracuniculus]|uniref:DNA topoisomerase 4 subunit B n=1 Tax=Haemophilus paracuniculus TaxID=734 RepID=A0A1T0AQG3_9PAST|nr:DNA topoisomerase IV subunit B [Haemophilus paracuniculus]OOR98179.1 DNA topoisomerase IV subunit B [Haemophilus paracuniculus]